MKKYTYLVDINCNRGYYQEFITIDYPVNSLFKIDDLRKIFTDKHGDHWLSITGISLMDIQDDNSR